MNNKAKFLGIGLVIGGFLGIIIGSLNDNLTGGIVYGGGFGLVIGLAVGYFLDRRVR
jgi:hypothetical protein